MYICMSMYGIFTYISYIGVVLVVNGVAYNRQNIYGSPRQVVFGIGIDPFAW